MKFIYADSLDFVDPNYDFLQDRNGLDRKPYWDDSFPHEILGFPPYDGILVSRGIVGGATVAGKYSEAQAMRFRRAGAREFLRLNSGALASLPIFGDCGAFTYNKQELPPYSSDDTASFYDDCGFTHGCSVDHIIFDFDEGQNGLGGGTQEARRRFDITIENARSFLTAVRHMTNRFTPLGVVQGWSPGSMAEAARLLCSMGYEYLAIGGTVPLKSPQIKSCLQAIRAAIPANTRIHILGFAKADDIASFASYRITSFDTTSPLLRAFKDAKANYYLPAGDKGTLLYYTAIRVPQALENTKLIRLAKRGILRQEQLLKLEATALKSLRDYDRQAEKLEPTLDAVLAYAIPATTGVPIEDLPVASDINVLRERYRRTLEERPWKKCSCVICTALSVEVVIFRASNRNKRRGIHNLSVFKSIVDKLPERNDGQPAHVHGAMRSSKPEPHGAELCRADV